ncbi:hypothetical protein AB0M36_35495 [Actinoplanes sp. NPDC051346]
MFLPYYRKALAGIGLAVVAVASAMAFSSPASAHGTVSCGACASIVATP